MADKIDVIENELETLLSADKKSWVRIYELMDSVEKENCTLTNFPATRNG